MELRVRGRVAGIDQAKFEEAAKAADILCPMSNSIRNNVEIKVNPMLD